MSSSSNNPKPSVVTDYPSTNPAATSGGATPSSTANGVPTATATAYPYYPNPNPNPNPYYYPPNPNPYYHPPNPNPNPNPNRTPLRRRLFIIAISVFIALGAAGLIVYLVFRPKLPSFSLTSLSVSSLNVTSNSLSASFDLSLSVQNPNSKLTIVYSRIITDVAFDESSLASTSLAPFTQPKGDVATLAAKMVAADEFVGDRAVGEIRSGRGNGVVKFDVRVMAVVSFRSGGWRMRRHELRVFCGGAGIGFKNGSVTAGSMTNGAMNC